MKMMNRKNIIIASLLMLGALTTEAQTIKVSGTEASANGEMQIVVTANANISNYIATGFYIELPEGFSVAGVEGVKGSAVQSNHVVRVGQTGTNKFRVAVYSLANSAFNLEGNTPTLCTLKLTAPNKEGSFTGQLTGVEFSTASHSLAKEDGSQFSITLNPDEAQTEGEESNTVKGDVNGDGHVDKADLQALVDYIMGKNPSPFNENLADVNQDYKVNVADVTEIVKIIKNNSSGSIDGDMHNDVEPDDPIVGDPSDI